MFLLDFSLNGIVAGIGSPSSWRLQYCDALKLLGNVDLLRYSPSGQLAIATNRNIEYRNLQSKLDLLGDAPQSPSVRPRGHITSHSRGRSIAHVFSHGAMLEEDPTSPFSRSTAEK